ncbi:hypothetical protein [Alkalibacterium sp.]|uniref:hypothetical protein n=1 Tax=Alkalibacterium sp. TaxID=1872447 RepID=UPI0039709CE6
MLKEKFLGEKSGLAIHLKRVWNAMQDIRASITAEINFLNKTLLKEGPGVVVFFLKKNET